MTRLSAATAGLAALLSLAACERPGVTARAPSTTAGIENDIASSRPASNIGAAPPIDIAIPTP